MVLEGQMFCGYLAFMPNALDVDTSEKIVNAVWSVAMPDCGLQWREWRKRSLQIPQGILTFVEATCYFTAADDETAEKILNSLVQTVMTTQSAHVGNAELLHHLPCPMPLKEYTMEDVSVPFSDVTAPTDPEVTRQAVDKFNDAGVVVLKSPVNESIVAQLRSAFETQYKAVKKALDMRNVKMTGSPFRFFEIVSRGEGRADMQFPLNDEQAAQGSVDIAALQHFATQSAPWGKVVRDILGDNVTLLRIGTVLSTPECKTEQYWHTDGAYTGSPASFDPLSKADGASHVGVFIPLVDLTDETGYTQFWPGSHKYARLLEKKGEASLPGDFNGIANAGDALIYDFRLVHRGMPNNSNTIRPIFYFIYSNGSANVDGVNFPSDNRLLALQKPSVK